MSQPLWSPIVDVVIPTRDRPAKLARCLAALAAARNNVPFHIFAVDSSPSPECAREVQEVCARYPFVSVYRHQRVGLAAARNVCTLAGTAPLIVSVDDDVYVAPDAIDRLLERYAAGRGWRVVAGQVFWGEHGSAGVRMRRIGYGVRDENERRADFFVTALILYPRALAKQCPFNERIASSDDRFVGALWRAKAVQQLWEPCAIAKHDDEHNTGLQAVSHQDSHIYTNLFDALLVRRSLTWAVAFEALGFVAGAKAHCRTARSAQAYCGAWLRGNARFVRDRRRLAALVERSLEGMPPELE